MRYYTNDIPDAPWIKRAELYGDPWYDPYFDNNEEDYDYDEESEDEEVE